MKKIIAFGFSAMLLLSACSNDIKDMVDNVPVPQLGLQYMEFTASTAETRTQLTSDNNVVWQAGDAISIFDGEGNRKFTTNDGGTNAVFGGNATGTTTYYALYPYLEGATIESNVIKNVTLPSEQAAKAGSFDATSNLSVAIASSDLQLAFKNVGSLVRFSVSNSQASKVRKVKLTSHDKTAVLTGTIDITLGDQLSATPTSGQLPSATLIADKGLETGKYYYLAVLPSELSTGFSLTFFDDEGKTWQKDYTKETNIARSISLQLDAIEIGNFTSSLLTNANLIAAAEKSTGRTFTKNEDGSVSLLDDDNYQIAMAVTSIDVRDKGDPSVCEQIGVFSNLKRLECDGNGITNLDLSDNTALTTLQCPNNQLTSLDLSKNTELTGLYCYNSQLTSLDLSKNTALTNLVCEDNQLTSLDLSKNTKLLRLECFNNQLTSLDLSKNTELKSVWCFNNQLTSLDISKNNNISFSYLGPWVGSQTDGSNNDQILSLYVNVNQITQNLPQGTVNGIEANKNVNILLKSDDATIAVTSVLLNKTSTELVVGGTETLTATVNPSNATNKNVTWSSSNTSVATVDSDGKVTAVAPGSATITVKTADGNKTATCSVTVKEGIDPVVSGTDMGGIN